MCPTASLTPSGRLLEIRPGVGNWSVLIERTDKEPDDRLESVLEHPAPSTVQGLIPDCHTLTWHPAKTLFGTEARACSKEGFNLFLWPRRGRTLPPRAIREFRSWIREDPQGEKEAA